MPESSILAVLSPGEDMSRPRPKGQTRKRSKLQNKLGEHPEKTAGIRSQADKMFSAKREAEKPKSGEWTEGGCTQGRPKADHRERGKEQRGRDTETETQ